MRSTISSAKRSPSMSSPTFAFGSPKCSRSAPVDVRAPPARPGRAVDLDERVAHVHQRRVDQVRDADRIVHRRAVEVGVAATCGSARRSPSAPRPSSRRGPPRASARCASSLISARCVTSSPTIVVSSPSTKTRCAASGSAQMLNSAAGVRLPSPIAPPIRTIRSGRASGCSAKSSADVRQRAGRDERQLAVAAADLVGEELDSVLLLGRAARAAAGRGRRARTRRARARRRRAARTNGLSAPA